MPPGARGGAETPPRTPSTPERFPAPKWGATERLGEGTLPLRLDAGAAHRKLG